MNPLCEEANGFVFVGLNAFGDEVRGEAYDLDPASHRYPYGPYGRLTVRMYVTYPTSLDEVQDLADEHLVRGREVIA